MEINKLRFRYLGQRISSVTLAIAVAGIALIQPTASNAGNSTGKLVSGLDEQYFDSTVRPQDDLYRYVNGKWLDSVEIPADKSRFGAFYELTDKTEAQLRIITDKLSSDTSIKANTDAQKIRDLYASFMNEAQLETLGTKPLLKELTIIDDLHSAVQLPTVFAQLTLQGVNVPIAPFVHSDNRDSIHYAFDLFQAGLGLPDRNYYLKDGNDGTYKKVREAYEKHIVAMLKLAGLPQPELSATQIMQLETTLATAQWDKVANRDPIKTYNKFLLKDLPAADDFDWQNYLQSLGVSGKINYLLINQPDYVAAVAKLTKTVPIETWQRYLQWKIIDDAAPFLSRAFVDENFDFNGKVLSGVPDIRARWKRGLSVIASSLGEALGRLYVEQYFPPENKRRMQALVKNLLTAYKQSIAGLDWMSPATKQQAQIKLAKITTKIGYPDSWRDYSRLQITPDDLLGNVLRAQEFEVQRQFNKLGKPIDRGEWQMTPQTINAYYNPEMNEIVFPAAILQAPFFNMQADDAVNYGAIGAVIGHEISHGFDDQGSQYDGDGNLHDWWTAEDHEKFGSKTKALVDQYSAYEPVSGYHVNGQLTLGENIADLSGLSIAYKAYQLSLKSGGIKKSAPVIDGLTGPQRFFAGFAQAWREKARDAEAIRLVTIDPHSPPRFRARTVINQAAFYTAFDVKPVDKMYLPPEQRVTIW